MTANQWAAMRRQGLLLGLIVGMAAAGCGLFQNERVSRGQGLYTHYCAHCHRDN